MLGQAREGFLEADDLDLRMASCRQAENVRVTATRTLSARPGTFMVRDGTGAYDIVEIRPDSSNVFGLVIQEATAIVINSDGDELYSIDPAPWTDPATVWAEPFRQKTVIGCPAGLYELTYDDGAWSFEEYVFDEAAGGELAQPYWSFADDTTITPSARTGSISLVASKDLWTADYVGLRVRYGQREILVTGYTSPTVISGTVTTLLPPSFKITVASTTGFRVGDAVIGQDTNFQGVISSISSPYLYVATTEFFDGPDVAESLSGPNTTSVISAKVEVSPLASYIWDEPAMSDVRGFPRSGASASGRLTLVDFPLVPDLICMSSSRGVNDFKAGAGDDDAIIRTSGDNSPRFLHVVNAGDLILLSDRGLYYVALRDGSVLSPSNFKAVLFDKRSANSVRPVSVDDGVVFVEASGEAIAACQLDGNYYLKWKVRTISTFHNELISTPKKLCGPSLFSGDTEKYLFVINNDGTVAAVSWFSDFSAESVGFVPWVTAGEFVSISPVFGAYWAIADRALGETTARFIERFSDDALTDCTVAISAAEDLEVNGVALEVNGGALQVVTNDAAPLVGAEVVISAGQWYCGEFTILEGGLIDGGEDIPANAYAGFNFVSSIMPWPVEVVDAPRAGLLKARVIRGAVSVLSSGSFSIRANNTTKTVGGYSWGDDLEIAPPLETRVFRFSVVGRRDHPEIEFIKSLPGAFEVMAITQEVQF